MTKIKLLTLGLATAILGISLVGVTTATSSYIHEVNGTISICDPDSNGMKCITMKDMNQGASEAGIGCINYSNYCAPMWESDGYESIEACIEDDMGTVYCNLSRESFGNTFSSQSDCESRGESLFESCMEDNSGVIGNHYQWGNNHGFAPCLDSDGCTSFPNNESSDSNAIDCTDYGPLQRLNTGTFIKNWAYCTSQTRNHNMRGGANDSQSNNRGFDVTGNTAIDPTNRKGPCDEGYHVPSIGEWNQVLEYWAQENRIELEEGDGGLKYNYDTLDGLKFQEDFKIPYAGIRYIDAQVYAIGDYANLGSSSPYVGNDYARRFALYPNVADANDNYYRGIAFSVRCFKDSYLSFPSSEPIVAEILLSVIKGTLTIGTTTGNLNLGEVNVSNSAQELSGSFGADSFWVEDMKGLETGYYTTISVTDLNGTVAGHSISASNVYLKTAGNTPTDISGATASEAKVIFGNGITDWHSGSGQVNYFQRLNTATADAGRVGKWGDNLQIKVNIPAHTPYDTYRGTITYTLYDLDS